MPKENNKMQVDIDNLFKQNVNDLSSIKEIYSKLEELQGKISQIKYIDSNLANKLKKEYEKLEKIILDENIQSKLTNDIKIINSQLDTKTSKEETKNIQAKLDNDIKTINSQLEHIEIKKANENFVKEEIAKAQLEGASVDTSNFVVQTELTSVLNPIQNVMYNNYMECSELNWVNQHLSTSSGGGTSSKWSIRCANFPSNIDLLLIVENASNYIFRIAEYTSNWTFVKMLVTDQRVDRYIFDKEKYYRISVSKADKSELTDDERTLIKQSLSLKKIRMSDDEIKDMLNSHQIIYSGLSSYLLNKLSYVPFCNSYIPKVAFVDDDGYETVLTNTIPLFESKKLPLTVACWSTSHVFDNNSNKNSLIAKLSDKLEIAQHTMRNMTGKTEEELRSYFDEQMNFWNTNNVTVNAMVYGYNKHDAMLRCIVSDYFKLACQGTNATLSNNTNRYALNRVRVQNASNLNVYKSYVDKAITNKESLIFFWHSNEISDNVELYNCLSSLLDYVITKTSKITPVLLSNII